MTKQTARLENWTQVLLGGEDSVVWGYVFGHPGFEDGMWIRTSLVVSLNRDDELLETRNTLYVLGAEGDRNPEQVDDEPIEDEVVS